MRRHILFCAGKLSFPCSARCPTISMPVAVDVRRRCHAAFSGGLESCTRIDSTLAHPLRKRYHVSRPIRMRKNQVFISYARKDRRWAEWLGERLSKHGFQIWTDTTSVPTGESFIAELGKMIEKSDLVLAILSPSYFESTWCQQETAVAAASKVPIIPVLVEPCDVQGFLRNYNWADLTSDANSGLRAVIQAAEQLPAQSLA